jgi:hypothetical protein
MHPDRRRRADALADLAQSGDWQTLYQRLTLEEFPYEARMGWQLAFLRPFAVPRMAQTLVDARQLVDQPRKRAYDTGLIIYEIVHGGFESPRAREMVRLINRSHHGFSIEAEDMTYVLCCFIVCPMRHIDLLGWRPLADDERESAARFFGRLGELMNIEDIPRTYAEAEIFFDTYEAAHVAVSPAARVLTKNLVTVLKDMQPALVRPFAIPTFTLLLNDRRVAAALGFRPPHLLTQRLVRQMLKVYGAIKRRQPPSNKVIFTPGKEVREMYPEGYELSDLGPHGLRTEQQPESSSDLN